jgi:uncharacterized membrane protein
MNRSKVTWALVCASLIAVLFDVGRGDVWGKMSLIYLVWNLFLAWIPYLISSFCIKRDMKVGYFIPLFILWLLFFPNAPYLVTDVLHIATRTAFPLWYDSLLFFFFGWIGLYLALLSLLDINRYLRAHLQFWVSEFAIVSICFVASFGVHLGRFERWNSWDLFTNPFKLVSNVQGIFFNVSHGFYPLIFISVFTVFIYAVYKVMYFSFPTDTL